MDVSRGWHCDRMSEPLCSQVKLVEAVQIVDLDQELLARVVIISIWGHYVVGLAYNANFLSEGLRGVNGNGDLLSIRCLRVGNWILSVGDVSRQSVCFCAGTPYEFAVFGLANAIRDYSIVRLKW